MSNLKKFLTFILVIMVSVFYSQEKNKSKIDNYLVNNYSLKSNQYSVKSSIETNPNYDVYYVQQKFNNIDVHNAISTMAIKNGEVKSYKNRFVDDSFGQSSLLVPKIDSYAAIEKGLNELKISEFKNSPNGWTQTNPYNVEAKLVYVVVDDKLNLTWNFNIVTIDHKNWYDIFVSADDGKIINVENWMINCEFDHSDSSKKHDHNHDHKFIGKQPSKSINDGSVYRVVPLPTPSPNHGPFELLSEPADLEASPFGWHDTDGQPGPEYTITRGNNVYAKEDDEGDGSLSGTDYSPDGGSDLNFDFTADLEQQPSQYMDASITNLFYINNMMHDIWYKYGFDESSGNFQENNYGNGGWGNDSVNADGQDGSGFNNASFGTPPDGQNPQMTMFLWSGPAGDPLTILDGSLAGEYTGQPAAFGESLPDETPLVGELALLYDSAPDVHDACNDITNPDDLNGKIVVIRRGECEFGTKILSAENAGAIAVIMTNNVPGGPITMGAGEDGDSVTIPSIMISQADGSALISQLQNGEIINASLINAANYTDSDLDNEIIAHEYGHGISNRLMGGAQAAGCMQNAEQQGEGFSDWFGLMITLGENDAPSIPRGVATYSAGQSPTGTGIRNAPYSPDFSINGYTYADSNNTAAVSQPHGVGFVFATMLWDLTWAFIDEYGFDPDLLNGTGGNNKVMQLVIDGLKLAPCSSGFVDMRDAILLADELTNNNVNECLIWNVFAARGLGFLAEQGDANSRTDQVEDFSIPSACEPATNNLDAGVISIDSPESGVLSDNENITITVRNFGINSISNFDVFYQVNGGENISETFNETITETIVSGATLQYTFESGVDFSIVDDYEIITGTLLENDEDTSNDIFTVNIISQEATNCPDNYELPIAWRDHFECYDAFIISDIGDWIMYDLDGGTTWGANAVDFENESYVGTGIIYNDELATITGAPAPEWDTYEGDQGLYFVASGANGTTIPNDDWMISPEFSLSGITSPVFSMKAKSVNDTYGLERFQIAVGNSTDYSEFTIISDGDFIEAPTEWTNYEFDLSAYEGQNIRIAIHYVGNDSFVLQTDAFKVEGTLGLAENEISDFEYYYNPFNYILNMTSSEKLSNIQIFNMLGQKIIEEDINSYNHQINLVDLSTSIYFIKVESNNGVKTFKLRVR
jgi:hypothetical protein